MTAPTDRPERRSGERRNERWDPIFDRDGVHGHLDLREGTDRRARPDSGGTEDAERQMTNAISVEDRIDVLLGRCARDRNHMTPITREFLHEIAARLRSHESPEPLAEAAQLAHGMKDAPCFSELLGEVDPDDPYCGCPVCVLRKIAALIPAPEPREP